MSFGDKNVAVEYFVLAKLDGGMFQVAIITLNQ